MGEALMMVGFVAAEWVVVVGWEAVVVGCEEAKELLFGGMVGFGAGVDRR